jgi:hypothetical protein
MEVIQNGLENGKLLKNLPKLSIYFRLLNDCAKFPMNCFSTIVLIYIIMRTQSVFCFYNRKFFFYYSWIDRNVLLRMTHI